MYVLDSDHLSLYQRGYEPIAQKIITLSPHEIYITVISAEELIRGRLSQIRKASSPYEKVRAYQWFIRTLEFLHSFSILGYGAKSEAQFQLYVEQKIRIGTQDLRIAAITKSNDATLITRNRKDFERVPHLNMENWSTL